VIIDGRAGLERAAAAGVPGMLEDTSGMQRSPGFDLEPAE
jgi:hypothetical protein